MWLKHKGQEHPTGKDYSCLITHEKIFCPTTYSTLWTLIGCGRTRKSGRKRAVWNWSFILLVTFYSEFPMSWESHKFSSIYHLKLLLNYQQLIGHCGVPTINLKMFLGRQSIHLNFEKLMDQGWKVQSLPSIKGTIRFIAKWTAQLTTLDKNAWSGGQQRLWR